MDVSLLRVPLLKRGTLYEKLRERGQLQELLKSMQYSAGGAYNVDLINQNDVSLKW